jgi:hypothetical protein
MPTQAATPALLHRFLGIGQLAMTVTFAALVAAGAVPLLEADEASTVAYAMAGAAALMIVVALVGLRPRVPERLGGETTEAYWARPGVAAAATRVWFALEGAGLLAGVGFLLTACVAPAVVMGAALVAFWMTGANAFAKA